MRIATLRWDAEKTTAVVQLDGTDGEDVNEGLRLVQCALREKPWIELEGAETPASVMRFFSTAFRMIGYRVELTGDIEVSR